MVSLSELNASVSEVAKLREAISDLNRQLLSKQGEMVSLQNVIKVYNSKDL